MDIRFARKEDKPAMMNLWAYCFRDGDAYIRWNFERRVREENTLLSIDQGKLCGMVELLPERFWVDGREIQASFIEGLAVAPHKRSCGMGSALMRSAFLQMKARGHAVSFLVPFSPSYYEKLGYGLVSYIREIRLDIASIRHYPADGEWQIARMDEECIQNLDAVYRAYCAGKNCFQLRSYTEWENILQDAAIAGGNVFLLKRAGACVGYLYYVLQKDTFCVKEMCFADYRAFGETMNFIRRHSPQVGQALLRLAESDPVVRGFAGGRGALQTFPYAMARVVDAQAVLAMLSRHFYGEAFLRIADAVCPWNSGLYCIRENEAALLEAGGAADPAVMEIGTLAELACGALSLEEAMYLGKVTGDAASLEGLFHKQNNFMNLMFE